MESDSQLIQMFRTIDAIMLLALAVIVFGAIVAAFLSRKSLSWLSDRFHGKVRFVLMASVPLVRLVIIVAAILLIVLRVLEPSVQNIVVLLGRIGVVYGEVRHVGIRAIDIVTADDSRVSIRHSKMWTEPISNANDGEPSLQCTADFYLHPEHDCGAVRATLRDVALTSPYLCFDRPIAVIVHEERWGTHYKLKAYPIDAAQQYRFVSDLTVRGKSALLELGVSFSNCIPGGIPPAGDP